MNQYLAAEVKAVDANGTWTAVANAPSVDRDGERILPGALLWRTPSLPVHVDHKIGTETLVGRCSPYYKGDTLMVDGRFGSTELAQRTRQQVVDGTLNSMSVVFHNSERRKGKDGVTEVTSGELLAVDFVTIASNVDARVLAARAYSGGLTVAEARALATKTLMDLARLELEDAQRVLDADRGAASRFVERQLRSI